MVDNKYVKKAEKELEYLSGDEETRRLAELREKAIKIAQKMLEKQMDIALIMDITGLTREEIEKM